MRQKRECLSRAEKSRDWRLPTIAALWIGLLLIRRSSIAVGQYHIDSWTTDSGLPHDSVRVIVQSRDGYLWLATADGLVRFDGVRFTVYSRENSPGMTGNRITALLEDNNGDLWMGSDGAVMRLHNGVSTGYGKESGVPTGWISAAKSLLPYRAVPRSRCSHHAAFVQRARLVCWASKRFRS
jgi:ligand-binding sensor domain-containing protein